MKITVKLFAYFRSHLPPDSDGLATVLDVGDGATAEEVLRSLGVPLYECRLGLINGITDVDPASWLKRELAEGDTLAVLPNIH